ncbi:MAG TPA: SpoIIE family protein phosphatase, partial [Acidimicrobiia bacterium]
MSRSEPSLLWTFWSVVVGLSGIVALAAFSVFLTSEGVGDQPLLQGPLAVNPAIDDQLVLLFSPRLVHGTQVVIHLVGFTFFAATAALLVARRPSSWVPVLGSAMLMAVGTSLFAPLSVLDGTGWETATRLVGIVSIEDLARYWASLAGVTLIAFFLVFSDGRWLPAWSRWAVVALGVLGVVSAFLPDSPANPVTWPDPIRLVWTVVVPFAVVASQTYRNAVLSAPEERLRNRPVLLSGSVAGITFGVLWVLQPELTSGAFGLVLATDRLRAIYDLNLLVLLTAAVFLFPVSIGFSVFRYRLFDIELIGNRALVYGGLSGFVILSFFGVATVILLLAGEGIGDQLTGGRAAVAGAVTGAILVTVFRPARRRIQASVDRRFYRQKYDAEKTVEEFAAAANELVDLAVLEQSVRDCLFETLHPTGIGIWLEGVAGQDIVLEEDVQQFLFGVGEAVDLAQAPEVVARLRSAGYEVAVPLISQRDLAGVLLLGPKEGGRRYSSLDFDLLDRLASRAAPALRMGQLVREQEAEALRRERVAQELEVARRIQHDLLPRDLPALDGWRLDVFYEPAREVGGDFYDFIALESGRWAVVVADVAGKGVPAAMVMATCRTLLRGAAVGRSPGDVLSTVNDLLRPDVPESMFVTCLYGILDPTDGKFVFANAGH